MSSTKQRHSKFRLWRFCRKRKRKHESHAEISPKMEVKDIKPETSAPSIDFTHKFRSKSFSGLPNETEVDFESTIFQKIGPNKLSCVETDEVISTKENTDQNLFVSSLMKAYNTDQKSSNDIAILAMNIDRYTKEVFNQLANGYHYIHAKEFIVLCQLLNIETELASQNCLNNQCDDTDCNVHIIFENFQKLLKKAVTNDSKFLAVNHNKTIRNPISKSLDKLAHPSKHLLLNDYGSPGKKNADTLIRMLLEQQKEIFMLRKLIEKMKIILITSDSQNLSLKIKLQMNNGLDNTISTTSTESLDISLTKEFLPQEHDSISEIHEDLQDEDWPTNHINETCKSLSLSEVELNTLKENLSNANKTIEQKDIKIEDLSLKLLVASSNIYKSECTIQSLHEQNDALQSQIDQYNHDTDIMKANIQKLSKMAESHRKQLIECKKTLRSAKQSRSKLLESLISTRNFLASILVSLTVEQQQTSHGIEHVNDPYEFIETPSHFYNSNRLYKDEVNLKTRPPLPNRDRKNNMKRQNYQEKINIAKCFENDDKLDSCQILEDLESELESLCHSLDEDDSID